MREVEAAHAGPGVHRHAFGEIDACVLRCVEQIEDRALLSVVGLRRIAGRRADAAILLGDGQQIAEHFAGHRLQPLVAHTQPIACEIAATPFRQRGEALCNIACLVAGDGFQDELILGEQWAVRRKTPITETHQGIRREAHKRAPTPADGRVERMVSG